MAGNGIARRRRIYDVDERNAIARDLSEECRAPHQTPYHEQPTMILRKRVTDETRNRVKEKRKEKTLPSTVCCEIRG